MTKDRWVIRRRVIFVSLLFIATCVIKVLWADSPSTGQTGLVEALVYTGGGIIGSYVFGATWDDKDVR